MGKRARADRWSRANSFSERFSHANLQGMFFAPLRFPRWQHYFFGVNDICSGLHGKRAVDIFDKFRVDAWVAVFCGFHTASQLVKQEPLASPPFPATATVNPFNAKASVCMCLDAHNATSRTSYHKYHMRIFSSQ